VRLQVARGGVRLAGVPHPLEPGHLPIGEAARALPARWLMVAADTAITLLSISFQAQIASLYAKTHLIRAN
jgi:hypothetical protein